jgi:hypothetical protein
MRSHNLLHNVEAQPGPPRFRGIQGLKNLGELLSWDTLPCIPHLKRDVGGRALARQRESSPLRHGVHSILHEVEEGAAKGTRMKATVPRSSSPSSRRMTP